jgi:hypothetical protein
MIEYKCRAGQTLAYNFSRICREGKWTRRVPKCGKYRIQVTIQNQCSDLCSGQSLSNTLIELRLSFKTHVLLISLNNKHFSFIKFS